MKQSIQTTQLLCDRARVYLNLTCNPTLVFQSWWLSAKATIFYFDCTWKPTWLASKTTKAEAAHTCGRTQVSAFLKAFQVIPGCEKVWEGRKDLKIDQMECCPESLIEEPWKVPMFNNISSNWPSSMSNIPIICIIFVGKGIYSPECHCKMWISHLIGEMH